jgi:hypothetical protein
MMSGEMWITIVSLLLQGLFAMLLVLFRSTVADLKNELVSLRELIWTDTVRKSELEEVKKDIQALYSKANARAETCAANHGKEHGK